MERLDRWLALLCGIVWLAAGYVFWMGWVDLKPWHFAVACIFLALHRIYGCTSFMGREG